MKYVALTIVIFGISIIQSCSNQNDKLLSASDELHYLVLYERGNEFEMLYNGLNTVKGTYSFKRDTILLTYAENQFEEFDPNKELTKKILIDDESKKLMSIDNHMKFCADIQLDKRKIKN